MCEDILTMFSHFNRRAEQSTNQAQSNAVHELDRNLTTAHEEIGTMTYKGDHWANYITEQQSNHSIREHKRRCIWHDTILALAIRCEWELFVMEELNLHGLPEKQGRPLLDYTVPVPETFPSSGEDGPWPCSNGLEALA
jgi:hypothetical protein